MDESKLPYFRPRNAGERVLLSLGTMNFGRRTPAPEAKKMVHRALERGVIMLDTANVYEGGASEKILGEAIKGRRDDCLIASKVGLDRPGGRVEGLSREAIFRACDGSLSRLGIEKIDLYYLHAPDDATPIEESMHALFELIYRGKIMHFGISNFASWQILEAFRVCDEARMQRPMVAQQMYNLLIRQLDIEYFKFTKRHRIHTTTYNALAGGLLARPHDIENIPHGSRFDKNVMYQRRFWSEHFFQFKKALVDLADAEGMPLADFAYAWLASSPSVDSILVGAGTTAQLDQAIDAAAKTLDAGVMKKVDELSRTFAGTDATYAR
jgi:aryl-alcohol dehydrogenase-like predicted oxidoreductase